MPNRELFIEFLRSRDKTKGLDYKQKLPNKSREIKVFSHQPRWTRRLKQKS